MKKKNYTCCFNGSGPGGHDWFGRILNSRNLHHHLLFIWILKSEQKKTSQTMEHRKNYTGDKTICDFSSLDFINLKTG